MALRLGGGRRRRDPGRRRLDRKGRIFVDRFWPHWSDVYGRGGALSSDLAMQSVRLGMNYRIGNDSTHLSDFLTKGPSALETDRFAFHAQATYVNQYDAPFPAPFSARTVLRRTSAARPLTSRCSRV